MEDRFLDLGLGRTRYIEAGAGAPVLLLHGMGMSNSANTFDTIIPGLARHFRVLALDQLGFGKGARDVKEGPTFELILGHVREFMDALGLEDAHVVGHSMGGWMAAHLAYQSPNRVKTLVLLNAAGLNAQPAPVVRAMTEVPSLEKLVEQVWGEFRDRSKVSEAQVRHLALRRHEALSQPNGLQSLDPLLRIMSTADIRSRYMLHRVLPHIKVPTLVLWSTGDVMDPYPTWTAEHARLQGDMSKSSKPWLIPGARYVMADAGHYTHWELPEYTVGLIRDFISGKIASS